MDWILEETTERKRINSINEIYDGNNLLIKEFIHLDLTNIDLSIIPKEEWEDCIFYNTSFKNTGIKFIPNKLKKINQEEAKSIGIKNYYCGNNIYMNFCDFSDNDLSYLEHKDFCKNDLIFEIYYYGCNFSNTNINYLRDLKNVYLDKLYEKFDYDYWRQGTYGIRNSYCDFETLIKNPFLNIPSDIFILILACARSKIINYYRDVKKENDEMIIKRLEECLIYDKQGYVRLLYEKIKSQLSIKGKYRFFLGSIYEQTLKDIDFSDIPIEVLDEFSINSNSFYL